MRSSKEPCLLLPKEGREDKKPRLLGDTISWRVRLPVWIRCRHHWPTTPSERERILFMLFVLSLYNNTFSPVDRCTLWTPQNRQQRKLSGSNSSFWIVLTIWSVPYFIFRIKLNTQCTEFRWFIHPPCYWEGKWYLPCQYLTRLSTITQRPFSFHGAPEYRKHLSFKGNSHGSKLYWNNQGTL